MSIPSLATTLVPGLSETGGVDLPVSPVVIGIATFLLLMAMMLGLLMFGAGRDHS